MSLDPRAPESTHSPPASPGRAGAQQRGEGVATDYAASLLRAAGALGEHRGGPRDRHPALAWAESGAMALCGEAGGAPRLAPGPLAACAEGALRALRALGDGPQLRCMDAPALLGERAAVLGLRRRGAVSPGGSCRLLRAADGWLAVNLARPDDAASLPAWLGEGDARDPWRFVRERVCRQPVRALVTRARLLGLAVAPAGSPPAAAPPWLRVAARGPRAPRSPGARPRVLDLSSLWAGPLAGHLLERAGARVVKVESVARPDGARRGPAAFFDLLNAGKRSVALDLERAEGRRALRALIEWADVVIESARPRALAQLGIDAERAVARRPGLTWVGVTGYGRAGSAGQWVAFGDDAAAAAGLAVGAGSAARPVFCGDAIADPLTGLHAAVAALASFRAGGGALLDLSLRDVAAHAAGFPAQDAGCVSLHAVGDGHEVRVERGSQMARARVLPPRARPVRERARPLGADTRAVLAELAVRC